LATAIVTLSAGLRLEIPTKCMLMCHWAMLALRFTSPSRLLAVVQFATTTQHQPDVHHQSSLKAPQSITGRPHYITRQQRAGPWHLQPCTSAYSTMVKSSKVPPLSSIEAATIKAKDGTELQAKTLWQSGPVFIYCIRRPGW
jgi:hypothetical protein